jgi:hypothetical protein
MRNGDFAVEIVPRGKGIGVREIGSGHVLARPGQVYALRLRNFGPLRCVAEVRIDGRVVTAGGLVIDARCTEELERPISPDENGCFTVVAEGDEHVFGPDGGRDNPDLGLVEVRFRRELPGGPERARPLPPTIGETLGRGPALPSHPQRPAPEMPTPWLGSASGDFAKPNANGLNRLGRFFPDRPSPSSLLNPTEESFDLDQSTVNDVERAAGTGLTGHSTQKFTPTHLGPLETEATVIQVRLVIATAEAIEAARAPMTEPAAPSRPAARP